MLHLYLFSTAIFMLTALLNILTALLNLLTACLHPSYGFAAQGFLLLTYPYSVHLSNAGVNQYTHSFIPNTGKLWNYLPMSVFPPAYDLNFSKRGVSRHL